MCSIVLGISTKDLDLNAVEAIVITFTCDTGGDEHSYSEVITHKEFKRMARNEMQDTERLQGLWDDMLGGQEQVWRCKLYKKLFMSKSALDVRIEIRTWDTGVGYDDGYDENEVNNRGGGSSMLSDYGSLALYFVEILTGAQEYNAQGCQDLDSASAEYPQVVTHYSSSMDGSHVVVATVAGSGDGEFEDEESDESDGDDNDWEGKQWFLQVWSFKGSIAGAEINKDSSSQEKGLFQPQLVAWMQLGSIKRWNSELSLSYDGTQLAILDAVPFGLSLSKSHADEKRVQKSIAAFYRCNISTTEAPEGAVAGSGLKRNHVEENHASLRKFCGWGQFHIVVSSNPDPKDELFVAYDGITIEVFSVYYETWSHVRSILLDHPKEELQLSTHDVHPALSGQLCGRLLVIKEPGRDQVLTMWDIELGVRASSFSGQAEEQSLAIGRTSVMSKDGKLVAIPGCRYVDLFWTESWTLAGTCSFPRMNLSAERIESIQFIRDGTEIIVMFKSQGYIVNTDTMRVTEQVISEGPDRILALNDSGRGARTLMFCVEDSRITLFNLDDRIVCSPSKVRERCCDSLCTIESPSKIKHDNTGGKKEEVVSPSSGLRFRAEKRTVTVIRAGHREGMSFVVATACDSDGSIVHRMSTPLPGAMVFRSAVFMGGAEGCSFLVVALDKLIMIWSTPTKSSSSSLQGKDSFVLRLVQNVDSNTQWKICPHNQLYGHKTPDPTMKQTDDQVIHNRHLYDPTTHAISFLKGVQELVEMFEFSSMALRRDILQYIGNHVNQSIWHSDRCYNVVSFLCENWSPRRHAAVLLFLRSLLYEDMAVRWVPRASAAHEEKEGDGNPILYLVAAARIDSKALEVAEVLVEYLVRRARVEKDPIYLTLIMQSLPKLVVHPGKDKKNNPNKEVLPLGTDEFVTHIYRHMAHLPTRPSRLPLGATKEEQEREWSGVHATLAPRKDTISKELYFASFDMLWYTINSSRTTTNGVGSGRMRVLSRMGVLWNVFVHKFKLSLKDTVRCYPFVEKEHGNPAIEALIDYKW
ncbi:hypothetical protein EC991_001829 [Linnemannia zychae]|nr:hypothetical protein EC991_001829 [Linnemannia zychae]